MARNLEQTLAARGYTCLFAIGFGERPDGSHSIKIAAHPGVKRLHGQTWDVCRETIIGALDKLMAAPLDDLEIER